MPDHHPVPPPSTYKTCLPHVVRSSFCSVSTDPKHVSDTQIPWTVSIDYSLLDECVCELDVVRCEFCKSYLNPFVEVLEPGYQWICNLCYGVNHVSVPFVKRDMSDFSGSRDAYNNGRDNNYNIRDNNNNYGRDNNNSRENNNNSRDDNYYDRENMNHIYGRENMNNNNCRDNNNNGRENMNNNSRDSESSFGTPVSINNLNRATNTFNTTDSQNTSSSQYSDNSVDTHYSSRLTRPKFDPISNMHVNKQYILPSLTTLSLDILSSPSFVFRTPPPPVTLFVIDCSVHSLQYNVLECALKNIYNIFYGDNNLSENFKGDLRHKFGVLFYTSLVYILRVDGSFDIVCDFDNVPRLFNDDYLFCPFNKYYDSISDKFEKCNIKDSIRNFEKNGIKEKDSDGKYNHIKDSNGNFGSKYKNNIKDSNDNSDSKNANNIKDSNDNFKNIKEKDSGAINNDTINNIKDYKSNTSIDDTGNNISDKFKSKEKGDFSLDLINYIITFFSTLSHSLVDLSGALLISRSILRTTGGSINIYLSSQVNSGHGSLLGSKSNTPFSIASSLSLDSKHTSSPYEYYKDLSKSMVENKIGINMFLFPHSDIGLWNFYSLSFFTNGNLFYYPNFNGNEKCYSDKFEEDMNTILNQHESNISKSNGNESDISKSNGNESDISKSDVNESNVNKSNINESDISKSNVNESNVNKLNNDIYINEYNVNKLNNDMNLNISNDIYINESDINEYNANKLNNDMNLNISNDMYIRSSSINKLYNGNDIYINKSNMSRLNYNLGFDGVGKVRCSSGIRVKKYYGQFYQYKQDLITFSNHNPFNNITIEMEYSNNSSYINSTCISFQSAVLRSIKGKRMINIINFVIPIKEFNNSHTNKNFFNNLYTKQNTNTYITNNKTSTLSIYDYVCIEQVIRFMAIKGTIISEFGKNTTRGSEMILKKIKDMINAYYKYNQYSTKLNNNKLNVHEKLYPITILSLSLLKSIPLRLTKSTPLDYRVFYSHIVIGGGSKIVDLIIQPILIPLHKIYKNECGSKNIELTNLSLEYLEMDGFYLLDTGINMFFFIACECNENIYKDILEKETRTGKFSLDIKNTSKYSGRIKEIVENLKRNRPLGVNCFLVRDDNKTSVYKDIFFSYFVEDRGQNMESIGEWVQKLKNETVRK